MLLEDGIEQLEPVITSKNTYVAPFVNAEETDKPQLVFDGVSVNCETSHRRSWPCRR